uniref:Protein krueppel n=1 Tax=Megaselia scalaris TaxID=36166 RepID=T1GW16_MEGSC
MQKTTNECRVCLENVRNFKEFTEILICDTEPQESILSIFEYSTSIDCSNYLEEGPMFLCISCIKNLKFVYDFIRQARESDEKLRNSSEIVAKPTEEIESVCEDEETSEFLETDTTSEIIYVTQPIESVAEYHSPDIIEEEFVLRAESESFLESLNEEENFMEHVAEEKTQVQQETNEKRICKRKPYVPRKDIPANFNCVHCDKNFVHNFLLKAHIRQYHEPGSKERNWQCSKCDKKFFKKEVLSRHLLTVHREGRDFKCNICGKEFQYKERLTRHLRIHIDRKFQCHICDKSYVQNADLNVHMRTHTNGSHSNVTNVRKHSQISPD